MNITWWTSLVCPKKVTDANCIFRDHDNNFCFDLKKLEKKKPSSVLVSSNLKWYFKARFPLTNFDTENFFKNCFRFRMGASIFMFAIFLRMIVMEQSKPALALKKYLKHLRHYHVVTLIMTEKQFEYRMENMLFSSYTAGEIPVLHNISDRWETK